MYVVFKYRHLFQCCLVQGNVNKAFLISLGSRIKKLRQNRNLTQEELAFMFDNHGEQVGRIERGQHNVKVCTLLEISKALEITLSELLDFEN